jgi:hypothetical protein
MINISKRIQASRYDSIPDALRLKAEPLLSPANSQIKRNLEGKAGRRSNSVSLITVSRFPL